MDDGAILHEVSHNLQNELQLERVVPLAILRRLRGGGVPDGVGRVWARWNREIFGDMLGVMLGGEAFVSSLMDVIGRARRRPWPTPPMPCTRRRTRTFLSCELLARLGFPERAEAFRRAWRRLYPSLEGTTILGRPRHLAPRGAAGRRGGLLHPFPLAGNKALREVLFFEPRHQLMIEEAADRLAKGVDPGVVPARPLIGAVRTALDRRLHPPTA